MDAEKAQEDVTKHVHKKSINAAIEAAASLAEKAAAMAREVGWKMLTLSLTLTL